MYKLVNYYKLIKQRQNTNHKRERMFVRTLVVFVVVVVVSCECAVDDWLLVPVQSSTKASVEVDGGLLVLRNGIISRVFTLPSENSTSWPAFATMDLTIDSLENGKSALRSIKPEAWVRVNGKDYAVGGFELFNQTCNMPADSGLTNAYLNRSIPSIRARARKNASSFTFSHFKASRNMSMPFDWEPGLRFSGNYTNWPPLGMHLELFFTAPPFFARIFKRDYRKGCVRNV